MTIKAYLTQAYRVDQRIKSKLEQVILLRDLASKATATLSDMPHSPNKDTCSIASIIAKIIDLENEINSDIDELVDLKREVIGIIKAIKNPEYQILLELRYLCFKNWEQIAVAMGYSSQHIFRLHGKALNSIDFLKEESKCDRKRV